MWKNARTAWIANRLFLPSLIIGYVILYYFEVSDLSETNLLLIKPLTLIMLVLFPIVLIIEIKKWRKMDFSQSSHTNDEGNEDDFDENYEVNSKLTPKLVFYIVSIALYLILLPYLGFVIMSLIFLPSLMLILGTKEKKLLIVLPIAVTLTMYILFDTWLGITLPKGFFG